MIHGYIRVSTADQVDGTSLADQERRIRAIASLRDDLEPTIWTDDISASIPLANRPSGGRLLASLEPGHTVIASKLDRLFRNAEDALARSREWRVAGVDLILIDMGTEPVTTSASGRLYFGMLAQFAEFERERIRERITDGKRAKRQANGFVGGHAPFGFRVVGHGRQSTLAPEPTELAIIRRAQLLRRTFNLGPTALATALNEEGHRARSNALIHPAQAWRWLRRDVSTVPI